MIATLLFWAVGLETLLAGALCVTARNLFHAALGLGAALVGVAALYFFLHAEYLAALQLVVYVGGILVLTVFGVMFSKDALGEHQRPGWPLRLGGLVLGTLVFIALLQQVRSVLAVPSVPRLGPGSAGASVAGLGDLLLGPALAPCALLVVLLLAVLVGALALVRKDEPGKNP